MLYVGSHPVRLDQLDSVFRSCSRERRVELGLRPSDLVVPIVNKMDTGPPTRAFRQVCCGVLRLKQAGAMLVARWLTDSVSSCVVLCGPPASPTLTQVVVDEVTEQAKTKPELVGLAVYLEVCTHYSSVFVPGKSPSDIIKSLGCVVYFMRIWDTWLREKHGSAREAEACCVTSACRTDLEISAACVINLLSFVYDCPDMVKLQEICTAEFGSDVCEDLFGFFGSWRSNSRVYSAVAARDKVCAFPCVHALIAADHTWVSPCGCSLSQRTPGW